MTTSNATRIQEIRAAAVMGAPPRTAAAARRGAGALAGVCRGLFGGPVRQQARTSSRIQGETVELPVSRPGGAPLASAA